MLWVLIFGFVIDVYFDLSKSSDSSITNNIREGNFVEVCGCFGYLDYLGWWGECNNSGEVFEFNLLLFCIFGFGWVYFVVEIVGEVIVRGCTSGLKMLLKFWLFDVEMLLLFWNIVSGIMVWNNIEVKWLIFGIWDMWVLFGCICEDRDSFDDVLYVARDFKVFLLMMVMGVWSLF